jgi:hypothetical protein
VGTGLAAGLGANVGGTISGDAAGAFEGAAEGATEGAGELDATEFPRGEHPLTSSSKHGRRKTLRSMIWSNSAYRIVIRLNYVDVNAPKLM